MKILIYGINFHPELTGTGKYTGEMATWMVENGHEVRVVTAPPYYPEWKVHKGFSKFKFSSGEFKGVKLIRCPLYVPKSPSTLKRLLHLSSFAITSFFALFKNISWKPTVIICIEPTLLCIPGAKALALITKSRLVLHIQDFEIDAMQGLGMANNSTLINIANFFEKACLKNLDIVSTISLSMMKRAREKGVPPERIVFFPNWAEIERFNSVDQNDVINLKKVLGLPEKRKVILYSGNVGEKQGLEILISVAELLREKNYIFMIVGEGGGKSKLECLVKEKSLSNVLFRHLQPYDLLPALLKIADCHLVIQRRGVAEAVLPSKLTNILAVGGNAVITADNNTELGKLCDTFPGIATLVEPESDKALLNGINQALSLPAENPVAKKYAMEFLNKKNILNDFMEKINFHE